MTKTMDSHREDAFKCIRCGLCQTVCPVYAEIYSEPAVARGKVRLIRELIDGNLEVTPRLKEIMDLCLDCKACVANCPAMVPTSELIFAARAYITSKEGLPLPMKGVLQGLSNNSLQEFGRMLMHFYQSSGVQKVIRGSGVVKAISEDLAHKESMMPIVASPGFRSIAPTLVGRKKGGMKVAYFVSCMTHLTGTELGKKVITVLEQHGCEVIIPTDVRCCGTPHLAYGDVEGATALAAHNMAVLNACGAEAIVTDCATCGSALKNYGKLIPESDDFAKKVYDISEFLVKVTGIKPGTVKNEIVVTYHDPCHLNRGQGEGAAARAVIRAVPGLTYKEMPEFDRCCGGAGSFGINHYELSMGILDRKIANVKSVNPQLVLTSCPACKMQLQHGLQRNSLDIAVKHPIELLADTYEL